MSMSKGEINTLTARDTGGKKLDENGHTLYRQIVGKLMYAMVGSRLDLTYPLSVLGAPPPHFTYHFTECPGEIHCLSRHILHGLS
jgi:hypothetical protein